jgi:hypothetical protein
MSRDIEAVSATEFAEAITLLAVRALVPVVLIINPVGFPFPSYTVCNDDVTPPGICNKLGNALLCCCDAKLGAVILFVPVSVYQRGYDYCALICESCVCHKVSLAR